MDETAQLILAKIDELCGEMRALRQQVESLSPQPLVSPPPADEYMTVEEAAAHFKLSRSVLYKLKHIQCRRGRSVRFKRTDLENHLRPRRWQSKTS